MFVFALFTFKKNRTTNPIKVYMVLSYVLYYDLEKYDCIDYLCFQYKTISDISSEKIFGNKS